MAEITLRVTSRVLDHAHGAREKERQIAYTLPSPDISGQLGAVTAQNHLNLQLGGLITLVVADRGAIWRAHNSRYGEDFDALFGLLARHPEKPMRFLCEIVK